MLLSFPSSCVIQFGSVGIRGGIVLIYKVVIMGPTYSQTRAHGPLGGGYTMSTGVIPHTGSIAGKDHFFYQQDVNGELIFVGGFLFFSLFRYFQQS